MQLSKGGHVAVIDGAHFALFRNTAETGGDGAKLTAEPHVAIDADQHGTELGHASSSANPSDSQQDEDGFAVGVAGHLNKLALGGKLTELVVIAAPRTLGALRKHYHKSLEALIVKELSKDLTGQSPGEIEKAVASA